MENAYLEMSGGGELHNPLPLRFPCSFEMLQRMGGDFHNGK